MTHSWPRMNVNDLRLVEVRSIHANQESRILIDVLWRLACSYKSLNILVGYRSGWVVPRSMGEKSIEVNPYGTSGYFHSISTSDALGYFWISPERWCRITPPTAAVYLYEKLNQLLSAFFRIKGDHALNVLIYIGELRTIDLYLRGSWLFWSNLETKLHIAGRFSMLWATTTTFSGPILLSRSQKYS